MTKRMLFGFAAVVLAAAGIFYRASSAHTARLQADAIVRQDAAGADVTASLASLKAFVAAHMGASVSFDLSTSYQKALAASHPASPATPVPTVNSQIYADAQRACSGKSDSITQARCNEAYIAAHMATPAPAPPSPTPGPTPNKADYHYAFSSPLWTPDLAGALLLGAVLSALFALLLGKSKGRRK